MRNKYRLCFSKTGALAFLGHLDLLKVFQQAVKRSGLPIAYSGGFNPHQQTGFALPLPLGMDGMAEYVDIELTQALPAAAIPESLNPALPDGLLIHAAIPLAEGDKSAAALVEKAAYEIELPYDPSLEKQLPQLIARLMASPVITVTRRAKGGLKEGDIRLDIFSIAYAGQDNETHSLKLHLLLSAGSARNLKADVVVAEIYRMADIPFDPYTVAYTRTELILSTEQPSCASPAQ